MPNLSSQCRTFTKLKKCHGYYLRRVQKKTPKLAKFGWIEEYPYLPEYWSIKNETYTNEQLNVLAVQRCPFRLSISLLFNNIKVVWFWKMPFLLFRKKLSKRKMGVLNWRTKLFLWRFYHSNSKALGIFARILCRKLPC